MKTGLFDDYIIALDYHKNRKDNNMKSFDNVHWHAEDVCVTTGYYPGEFEITSKIYGHADGSIHDIAFKNMPKLIEAKLNSSLTSDWDKWKNTNPTQFLGNKPEVKDVIFNPPATVVLWKDGTKTVVKAQEGCEFDPWVGLAMAFSKKLFGNKGNYFEVFKKYCEPYEEKMAKEEEEEFTGFLEAIREAAAKAAVSLAALQIPELKLNIEEAKKKEEETHSDIVEKFSYDTMLIFETRNNAEKILDQMKEIVKHYGVVSVADLFDLADAKHVDYLANDRGWLNLKNVEVKRVRNGYIIDLPKPQPIK